MVDISLFAPTMLETWEFDPKKNIITQYGNKQLQRYQPVNILSNTQLNANRNFFEKTQQKGFDVLNRPLHYETIDNLQKYLSVEHRIKARTSQTGYNFTTLINSNIVTNTTYVPEIINSNETAYVPVNDWLAKEKVGFTLEKLFVRNINNRFSSDNLYAMKTKDYDLYQILEDVLLLFKKDSEIYKISLNKQDIDKSELITQQFLVEKIKLNNPEINYNKQRNSFLHKAIAASVLLNRLNIKQLIREPLAAKVDAHLQNKQQTLIINKNKLYELKESQLRQVKNNAKMLEMKNNLSKNLNADKIEAAKAMRVEQMHKQIKQVEIKLAQKLELQQELEQKADLQSLQNANKLEKQELSKVSFLDTSSKLIFSDAKHNHHYKYKIFKHKTSRAGFNKFKLQKHYLLENVFNKLDFNKSFASSSNNNANLDLVYKSGISKHIKNTNAQLNQDLYDKYAVNLLQPDESDTPIIFHKKAIEEYIDNAEELNQDDKNIPEQRSDDLMQKDLVVGNDKNELQINVDSKTEDIRLNIDMSHRQYTPVYAIDFNIPQMAAVNFIEPSKSTKMIIDANKQLEIAVKQALYPSNETVLSVLDRK